VAGQDPGHRESASRINGQIDQGSALHRSDGLPFSTRREGADARSSNGDRHHWPWADALIVSYKTKGNLLNLLSATALRL